MRATLESPRPLAFVLGALLVSACGESSGGGGSGGDDTSSPATVLTLNIIGSSASSVDLAWTAPGDDANVGSALSYDLRFSTTPITAATWDAATPAAGEPSPAVAGSPQLHQVDSLASATLYYFALRTLDDAGNISSLSNVVSTTTLPESTPPSSVVDLSVTGSSPSSVDLAWTAPGDDGSVGTATSYELRFSTSQISDATWAAASPAAGEPSPGSAGAPQAFTVTGLAGGTLYYFALKTSDEAGNESFLSNVVSTTLPDGTAPSAVANLSVTAVSLSGLTLSWTSPGDDGSTGTATSYDLRYNTAPITEATWATAAQASGEPAPAAAGTTQGFSLSGLSSGTPYYVALKTSDEAGNASALSNVASATTSVPPDLTPPAAVLDLAVVDSTPSTLTVLWTSPGDDGSTGTATSYDVRHSASPITEATWALATAALGEPAPRVAGTRQHLTFGGLSLGVRYYIAMKTTDDAGHVSDLSNVVDAVTAFVPSVAFLAGDSTANNEHMSLYVTDQRGSIVRDLSGPIVPGGTVWDFVWSPDRSKIAFRARKEVADFLALFVVPSDGSAPAIKVSGTVSAAYVSPNSLQWAPDGSKLAFLGGKLWNGGSGTQQLYRVNADGSGLITLNPPLPDMANIWRFSWAPNGSRVAYDGEQESFGKTEVFTCLPDGGGNVKVSVIGPPFGGYAGGSRWSPDSQHIAYVGMGETLGVYELYTTLPDSPTVTKVSHPLVGTEDVEYDFSWSPDGTRLGYIAYSEARNARELHSVRQDGTGYAALSPNGSISGSFEQSVLWNPAGDRVAYVLSQSRYELHTATADGSEIRRVASRYAHDVVQKHFQWAPDGSRLAFIGEENIPQVPELFTTLPDGSSMTRVSQPAVLGDHVSGFEWSPDSSRLLFIADPNFWGTQELYVTRPDSSDFILKVSGPMFVGANVWGQFGWAAGGNRVIYVADQAVDEVFELWSSFPELPLDNRRISPALAGEADVKSFKVR